MAQGRNRGVGGAAMGTTNWGFRMIGRLLCAFGVHRERLDAVFRQPGRNTVYGVVCTRCGAPRCTIGGARPMPPPSPSDRAKPDNLDEARAWLERRIGGPTPDSFLWWR